MGQSTSNIAAAVAVRPLTMTKDPSTEGARRRQPVVRTGARDREEPWSLKLSEAERRHLTSDLVALTDREREVVFAICSGGPNEAVAERLFIALPTLRTHLMRVNQKLGTRSKADVVRFVVGRLLEGYRQNGALPTKADAAANDTTKGGEIEIKTRPTTNSSPTTGVGGGAGASGGSGGLGSGGSGSGAT